MNITQLYEKYIENPVITTDSRNVPEGSIFFALKGDNFDGHKFVEKALQKGAKYAVISDKNYEIEGKTFLFDDTLKTLQELAHAHAMRMNADVIGITGSNGKTTTKELIYSVLKKKYKVLATKGNFNNHIGVPLTILSVADDVELAIIEMGANHQGEIAELCEIAHPVMGVITNIGNAHLGGFGSLENLIETKLALFRYIEKLNNIFFLNTSDEILSKRVRFVIPRIFLYGKDENSIVRAKEIFNDVFLKLKVVISGKDYDISTKLIGKYNVDNIFAAITVGIINEVPINDIITGIEEYEPTNNRSQLIETEDNTLILDMYNANPTSMHEAIDNFSKINLPNKNLIIGDMLELGEVEQAEHQQIVNFVNTLQFDEIYLIGEIFGNCDNIKKHKSFKNIDDFNNYLVKNKIKGKSILLKASNGTGLKKCVEFL